MQLECESCGCWFDLVPELTKVVILRCQPLVSPVKTQCPACGVSRLTFCRSLHELKVLIESNCQWECGKDFASEHILAQFYHEMGYESLLGEAARKLSSDQADRYLLGLNDLDETQCFHQFVRLCSEHGRPRDIAA